MNNLNRPAMVAALDMVAALVFLAGLIILVGLIVGSLHG